MEGLTNKVKDFIAIGEGLGCGDSISRDMHNGGSAGNFYGDGEGWGNNLGAGYGMGDGDGAGYGSAYQGDGVCDGHILVIKSINGETVYAIDCIPTIIQAVHENVARGAILNADLTLTPCYIVKQNSKFAHGKTLRYAMAALREKLFYDMPEQERINAFLTEHKTGVEYPCQDLYEWHHYLTGSCEIGRKQFAKNHGIDIEKDSMTVERFIELTRNAYGGDIIKKVEKAYQDGNINSGH